MPSTRKSHQIKDAARKATHYEELGTRSADLYAPVIMAQAREQNVPLPLTAADARQLFDNTIADLERSGEMVWSNVRGPMRNVFARAWYETLAKKGIL